MMGPGPSRLQNGSLGDMRDDLAYLKEHLPDSMERTTVAIAQLTTAVSTLSEKIEMIVSMSKDTVPLKVVFWIFCGFLAILVGQEGLGKLVEHFIAR